MLTGLSGSFLLITLVLLALPLSAAAQPTEPSRTGLVLWLDASSPESAEADADGLVGVWRDLSGRGNHLQAAGERHPSLVPDGMNGKPVLRFAGAQQMRMSRGIREDAGSGAILVVWQRSASQVEGQEWQRIISSRHDKAKQDNAAPNFCVIPDPSGKPAAVPPTILDAEITERPIAELVVGSASSVDWHFLSGDIAEILVYDRAFLSEGEIQEALGYLKAKWNARVAREENGWTRTGELGPTPAHVRQDLPLSDQENKGNWTLDPAFTDEFTGDSIDMKRWHLNPTAPGDWEGRQPALFAPENVSQSDGMLHLTFRIAEIPEKYRAKGYERYTSCLIQSNDLTGYGYYEARAKPMNSAASSSFWFTETRLEDNATEIDVFEIGGKAPGFERKYNMNAHVWRTPEEKRHWAVGGVWNAPFRFVDDFHVYGFEWNEQELTWYVDGVPVRRAKNTNWFFPMRVMFDSEAMWSWFGKVDDADLPSTFSIDYIRVWRQERPAPDKGANP